MLLRILNLRTVGFDLWEVLKEEHVLLLYLLSFSLELKYDGRSFCSSLGP